MYTPWCSGVPAYFCATLSPESECCAGRAPRHCGSVARNPEVNRARAYTFVCATAVRSEEHTALSAEPSIR